MSCEECFERLDEYVELELEGADAEARVPGMRAHLDGCPACREEHESLRARQSLSCNELVAHVTHACAGAEQAECMSQDEPTGEQAEQPSREQAERAMRQLLADHDLPEPDEILDHDDGGIVCLWHEPKVAVVVDLEPRAA